MKKILIFFSVITIAQIFFIKEFLVLANNDEKYIKKLINNSTFITNQGEKIREKFGIHSRQKRKKLGRTVDHISVQTVQAITEDNLLQLTSGALVKIDGVIFPSEKSPGQQCFLSESRNFLQQLLVGKKIYLKKANDTVDEISQPLLRSVLVANKPKELSPLLALDEVLIRTGYAKTSSNANKELSALQKSVYQSPVGAWKKCFTQIQNTSDGAPKDCPIKGNITGTKSSPIKKYHTINSPWYERTIAEECFETESEAEAAGFLRVK